LKSELFDTEPTINPGNCFVVAKGHYIPTEVTLKVDALPPSKISWW
jgi:hypothetical protein